MSRYAVWIIGVLAVAGGCSVDEPSANVGEAATGEVTGAVKCNNCTPPPPRCEVDAQGHETGRCIVDDAAHGLCAIGRSGVQGCVLGRQGTVTQGGCFAFDQSTCSATSWVL